MDSIPIWLYVAAVIVTGIVCYVGGYIEGRHGRTDSIRAKP
jgi:hypothetical protein